MSIILNDRDKALQAAAFRTMSTTVDIVSSNGSAFRTLKNGGTTTPTDTVLTATASSIFTAEAIYTWQYSLSSSATTWVPISAGTNNTLTVTSDSILANIGTAASINYRCVVTEPSLITATGYYNIIYNKELSESVVIDMSRTSAIVPCSSDGTPTGFSNTDTTISVSRGGTALSYSATGGANTFSVAIQADNAARTVGTISTTATTYSISGITAITLDLATVVFAVTVYDAAGTALTPVAKQITYTKITNGVVGADVTAYYIESTAPVISKTTAGALLPGTHSQITITGKKAAGNALPVNYGFLTLTPNGVSEATVATANTITTTIGNSDGKTIYTINMYNQATVAGATLLDTMTVPVIFTGANAITALLTNESSSIPTNYLGTVGVYTGSGTDIHVYEGSTELTYDGVGVTTGTWTVSTFASNITIGAITDAGLYARVANASNILSSTASIVYTITGISGGGVPFSITKTQSFGRTLDGKDGASFAISNSFAAFNKDAAGTKTPASLTISTGYQNITGTITYQWQKNGVNIPGANASTYTVLIADYASVTTNTYKCTITGTINAVVNSTLSDQITIPLLADGPGAINVTNSNENITFTAPNTGYTGILFGSSTVAIRAFIGTVALTYDAADTPANNTFKVTQAVSGFTVAAGTGTGTTYTVAAPTAASSDTGFITFTVVIKDNSGVSTTTTTTTTYSLSRLGSTASTFSITNSAATFVKNEAGVLSPATLTLNTTIANITSPTYQWYKGVTLIPGATAASYTITATTDYPSGTETNQYRCVITGTINSIANSTLSDFITVPLLVAGSSAVTINNSNENIVFSAPNTGYSGISFTSGSFVVRAYIGSTGLTYDAATTPANNTFKVTVVTTGATVAAGTGSGTTYTIPAPTAISTDSASTTVTVTIKNSAGLTSTIDTTTTYGLSRTGPTAGMFNIANSAVIFTKNAAGSVLPVSSVLTTTSQNITSPTYQWQKNGVDISGATTSTYTVLIADYSAVTTNTYKCIVTGTIAGVSSSTLSDQITIPLLSDGSSAITINNSNENITFPSSNSGYSGINFTNGSSVIRAYLGTTALTYDGAATPANNTFKVSVVTTGATVAAGVGTGSTYTIPAPTAMSVDAASTVVTVTVKNAAGVTTDIVTTTTYSLSRVGPLGSTFNIANSIVVFSKNNAGNITPATATLSTAYVNITNPTYQWQKNGTNIPGATLSTYDVSNSDYSSVITNTYKCTVTGTINGVASSTLSDQITVPLLTDGATTPSIINSNENITFIAENSGYNNISFTKGSFTITAYIGTTALAYDAAANPANSTFKVTFSATGATVAAGSGSGTTYTIPAPTAMSSDSASNILTITIKDAAGVVSTFTKTTYYNLSRMGNPGSSFVINNSFAAFNKDASGNKTPATLSLTTAYQNITGTLTYQWQKNASNISGATSSTYIVPIADYASVSTNTYKCTISGIINGSANTISDQITIPLLADGLGAINVLNSNENITFTAPSTGYTGINFGTSTVVIRAFIGTVDLTYDGAATPANNTFKVTQSVSGFSVPAGNGTGTTYTVAAPTAATVDSGFVTFTVTIKDNFGVSSTVTTTTTYSLSRIGITPATFNIGNSAAIFTKNEAGTLSPATLVLSTTTQNITTPTYQWQKNGTNIPGGTAATYTVTAATDYTVGVESNIYKCTVTGTMAGVTGQTLFDQITIPLLVAGSSAITVNNSNENIVFSAPNTGYAGITFTGGSFIVRAYIGTAELAYNATNAVNNTFKVSVSTTGATVAAGTGSGNTYSIPAPTAMSTDSASTVVTVTIKNAAGVLSTIVTTTTYGLSRVGPTGAGNKSVTISAYAWGLTMPAIPTTSLTYTWATGAITYPTGWVKQPTIGTTGQTLYQINLIITGLTTDATTTGIDWAAATSNTVGYRLDGSIGPQGTSARVAYVVTTRITPPPSPTAGTGDVIPSSTVTNINGTQAAWSFTATATLLADQYMYTVDGIWTATATTINGVAIAANNIAWGVPYLSNLKVGSLSALSANLGVITGGSLNINNKFMVGTDGATTIQSGTTGARMLTTENFIKIYDTNGALRVQLGNLSM